ncbi:intracellular septation protein A [Caulobacter zeae]|uniref:Inner membrane-spanning protein YciB n=1 Tax=Caulobacter zeae TaxID=2055137 RepID=A0A2N5CXZ9_9CAUL|nr:inner membrane-spanning protein YciB [Caulobacter zeae]PLR18687.1 intracellular septation protein A [Caulobacter zeae]
MTRPEAPKPKSAGWVRHTVDYGPLLAFLVGFLVTKSMTTATWVLVVASAIALAFGFAVEKRLAPMPLIAGLGALVFGGLALVFHDPRLLKIKPTVLNIAYAAFLFGGLLFAKNPLKVLLGEALHMDDAAWRTLTIRYACYFLVAAAANEVVWRTQSDTVWVWFKFPGLALLAVLFSLTQVPFFLKHLAKPEEEKMPEPPVT